MPGIKVVKRYKERVPCFNWFRLGLDGLENFLKISGCLIFKLISVLCIYPQTGILENLHPIYQQLLRRNFVGKALPRNCKVVASILIGGSKKLRYFSLAMFPINLQ